MSWVDQKVKQAKASGYSQGYLAGRRRAEQDGCRAKSLPPAPPAWRTDDAIPPGPYSDIQRSLRSMDMFFTGLIDEYPNAVGTGRMDKWAAAATAFIDLMASVDKPMKRAHLKVVGGLGDERGG